ncbi:MULTISPECIES: hypothetical protein [Yersinia]|uniref:hypothetical protein n=1 Tax=Yersinia TaxID=629 RepID=UPI0005E71193|nr:MULTISPECIES: hypothetical protein [Yersinia]RXA98350.1 hypothetical protein EQP49_02075 [Yersinia sp. 2105 StPb PI]CNH86397.1 Uncharacterised protein [Yersinia frederiksenii]CNI15333.1 Uncharacterised protein [Yersinia frederiksenii]CNK00897.1 Uncharacterised protein [Yersinia frederiksenii]
MNNPIKYLLLSLIIPLSANACIEDGGEPSECAIACTLPSGDIDEGCYFGDSPPYTYDQPVPEVSEATGQ